MAKSVFLQGNQGLQFSFDDYESFEAQKERWQKFLVKYHRFFEEEPLKIDLGLREKKKAEIREIAEDAGVKVVFTTTEEKLEGVKFVMRTVRSGQEEKCRENIVVLGGVNPGGVVSAGGHVVVLGEVRGKVQAGQKQPDAFVAALKFSPEKLEIGKEGEVQPVVDAPSLVKVTKDGYKTEPF